MNDNVTVISDIAVPNKNLKQSTKYKTQLCMRLLLHIKKMTMMDFIRERQQLFYQMEKENLYLKKTMLSFHIQVNG